MQDPKVLNRGGGATQLKQGAAPLPSADGGFRRHHRRAVVADRSARILIVSGGIAIIIAVVGILAFVVGESLPLWFGADHDVRSSADASSLLRAKQPLLVGVDEYQEIVYVISDSATVEFISLDEAIWMKSAPIGSLQGDRITSISRSLTGDIIGIGSSSGKVGMLEVNYDVSFASDGRRVLEPVVFERGAVQLDIKGRPVTEVAYRVDEDDQPTIVGLVAGKELVLYALEQTPSLFGEGEKLEYRRDLTSMTEGKISTIAMDDLGETLVVGTGEGRLFYISLREKENPALLHVVDASLGPGPAVTSLEFLLGDQSVVVGDAAGNVSSWMRTLDEEAESGWTLVRPHLFKSHGSAVTEIAPSPRNKGFLTGDSNGGLHLNHLTGERVLIEIAGNGVPIKDLRFAPKADGALVLYENGTITRLGIENPHPEATLGVTFGKVWYEGYQRPAYVWQSTGGTDDFEPKLSFIPLILGTLKGTFYALIFAVPIALLGAMYTSQFSHPSIRNVIKPTVEVMAALPSVVIGFLAGLWLAPMLEKIFPSVVLMALVLPSMAFIGVMLWRYVPRGFRGRFKHGTEVILIIPLLVLGGQISLWLSPWFETAFLGGDYRAWLLEFLGERYDQRNSVAVGFALGFAVIPIIFTICEDALTSVPQHLTSASLALGASRWQTALRVVLPTASPGIFSAIMIGFGRAIGETMIVLMATGNTPLLDFSPFNGMRTLSANIAVEIPEAPYQGTLYRVLFFSAALLFVLTFIVNTGAEIIRNRLRRKYMHV